MKLSTPFKFATRLSIAATLSTVFLFWESLSASPSSSESAFSIPQQSVWVFITVNLVSWFPSMDSASVMRKTFERIVGTTCGACLGLGLGFLWETTTTSFPSILRSVIFMGMLGFAVFLYSFAVLKFDWIEHQFSYAAVMGLVTLGISIFPFMEDTERWWVGLIRIVNVILGCILGGAVCLLVWPQSTHSQLCQKVQNQIQLSGEASEAVLLAASRVLGQPKTTGNGSGKAVDTELKPLPQILRQHEEEDLVHQKYAQALHEWNAAKTLFPMLPYDPFRYFCAQKWSSTMFLGGTLTSNTLDDDQETQSYPSSTRRPSFTTKTFQDQATITLARAFRLQTTVVLLDSFVRNYASSSRSEHSSYCSFPEEELRLFARVGRLLGRLLATEAEEIGGEKGGAGGGHGTKSAELQKKQEQRPSCSKSPQNGTEHSNDTRVDEELAIPRCQEDRFTNEPEGVSRTTAMISAATVPEESNSNANGDKAHQHPTARARPPAPKTTSTLTATTDSASPSNTALTTNADVLITLRTSNVVISKKTVTQCLLKELRVVRKLIVNEAAIMVAAAAASASPLSGSVLSQEKENELLIQDLQNQQYDQGTPAVFLGFNTHSTNGDEATSSHAIPPASSLSSSRLLFLQLVEHLILRGLRLHYATTAPTNDADEHHTNNY